VKFSAIRARNGEADAGIQISVAVIVDRNASVVGNLKILAEKGCLLPGTDKHQFHSE
jgi:hypothetical protein